MFKNRDWPAWKLAALFPLRPGPLGGLICVVKCRPDRSIRLREYGLVWHGIWLEGYKRDGIVLAKGTLKISSFQRVCSAVTISLMVRATADQ